MESMKYIMRYNDYQNDSYSLGSPMNAICSRGDLLDPPEAGGCYDTKVISISLYACMGIGFDAIPRGIRNPVIWKSAYH